MAEAEGSYNNFKGPSTRINVLLEPGSDGKVIADVLEALDVIDEDSAMRLNLRNPVGDSTVWVDVSYDDGLSAEQLDAVLGVAAELEQLGGTSFSFGTSPDGEVLAKDGLWCRAVFEGLDQAQVGAAITAMRAEPSCYRIDVGNAHRRDGHRGHQPLPGRHACATRAHAGPPRDLRGGRHDPPDTELHHARR